MTAKHLIDILSQFPSDSHINFCVFSNLTPKRCDVSDSHVMVLHSPHTGDVNIMLDLEKYWENDIVNSVNSINSNPSVNTFN